MRSDQLRQMYISYFVDRGHTEIPGASLIPENDPTVLFTTAGMHPLVPYILGELHPAGERLVNYQRCIRTGDIDEVGDPHHLTFFEMLGNWSLGDYFKEESILMSHEFLTSPNWLGLSSDALSITVFEGDADAPRDEESWGHWRSLGIPDERIHFLPRSDNWWGPAGETGPCGPDSEIFIDSGRPKCGANCRPGCGCGKYFEVWNNVFMEYQKNGDGSFTRLDRCCVDTGMGIERTCAMLQGVGSVYEIETFAPLIRTIEGVAGVRFGDSDDIDRSIRVIADHVKTATFILGDEAGITPSNLGQGYILRRLIRRALRHGRKIGISGEFITPIAGMVLEHYGETYPGIASRGVEIVAELKEEVERFDRTLKNGEKEFARMVPQLLKNPNRVIPGRIAFKLYDTYGFPIEITEELAGEYELSVDREGFESAFKKHQQVSRGSESSFKGGLADHSEMTTALHTATHLLHQALRMVLGDHIRQKGSNITTARLRFDFSHPEKMSQEEIARVEEIVNRQIQLNLPVAMEILSLDEAVGQGAIAFFEEKYGEKVKVYSVGEFSKEVCGGPHVERTGTMGVFKILKEQSSSSGVRRIRAVLEGAGSA